MAADTALRWYTRLPECYRTDDLAQGLALLGFLRLLGDQASELEDLRDRIDYVGPYDGGAPGDTSDLVDASTAEASWLDWIALALGYERGDLVLGDLRDLLVESPPRLPATRDVLIAAAKAILSGTKTVYFGRHQAPSPWGLVIQTLPAETPDLATLVRALEPHKPAGHILRAAVSANRIIDVLEGSINGLAGTINAL